MRKMIPAYLTVLTCALLAVNSYAAKDSDHQDSHHEMHFNPMHRMTDRLGLSQDQQQKFNALQEKDKASYQAQYEALRENNAQLVFTNPEYRRWLNESFNRAEASRHTAMTKLFQLGRALSFWR